MITTNPKTQMLIDLLEPTGKAISLGDVLLNSIDRHTDFRRLNSFDADGKTVSNLVICGRLFMDTEVKIRFGEDYAITTPINYSFNPNAGLASNPKTTDEFIDFFEYNEGELIVAANLGDAIYIDVYNKEIIERISAFGGDDYETVGFGEDGHVSLCIRGASKGWAAIILESYLSATSDSDAYKALSASIAKTLKENAINLLKSPTHIA